MSSSDPPLNMNLRGGSSEVSNGYENNSRFQLNSGLNLSADSALGSSANNADFIPSSINQDSLEQPTSVNLSGTSTEFKPELIVNNMVEANGISSAISTTHNR